MEHLQQPSLDDGAAAGRALLDARTGVAKAFARGNYGGFSELQLPRVDRSFVQKTAAGC